jgi:hypothetical protein
VRTKENKLSELSKKDLKKWKKTITEGVFFMVGIEIKNKRKAAFINICRFANGNVLSDKHMRHQGHLVGQLFLGEFMKCNADKCLMGAPEDVLDSLINGKLYKYISDLFIHAFYRLEKQAIDATISNWESWSGVIDSVSASQDVEPQPEIILQGE